VDAPFLRIDGKKLRGSAIKLEQQTARSEGGRSHALDVFWGEDDSRKRIDAAAANFGIVLRIG